VEKRHAEGYSLVDFEGYMIGNAMRYAAIWEKRPGVATTVRTDRTVPEYEALWNQYRDEKLRPIDTEMYNTPNGVRFGGVWAGPLPEGK
jgi:hypothetical protein